MPELNILDDVVCYAVRYCLSRLSYANHDGIRIVRHYWPQLSERERSVIRRDIEEAIEENERAQELGHNHWFDDQLQGWKRLLEEIGQEEGFG